MFEVQLYSGSWINIAQKHALLNRDRIISQIHFYKSILDTNIYSEYIKDMLIFLKKQHRDLYDMVITMATTTEIDIYDIILINARSELMNFATDKSNTITECSTLAFQNSGIIGQNRDFMENVTPNTIIHISNTWKRTIRMLQEVGILGKVWMNSDWIAVCLNFIKWPITSIGLPIHFLLRKILQCSTLQEANTVIYEHKAWKSWSVTVMDATWRFNCYEFYDNDVYITQDNDQTFFRTNHYLSPQILALFSQKRSQEFLSQSTRVRYETIQKYMKDKDIHSEDIVSIKAVLWESEHGDYSILSPFHLNNLYNTKVGTIASLIFDCKNKIVHCSTNPLIHKYTTFHL